MTTQTKTIVLEERLSAAPLSVAPTNAVAKRSVGYLMRSSSFNRLRQFPNYFCHQGSTEIIQWISSSRSKLSQNLVDFSKQFRLILLIASVYAAIGLLALQLIVCLFVVITNQVPLGLLFLMACVAAMAHLASKIFIPSTSSPTKHRSRITIRRAKQD